MNPILMFLTLMSIISKALGRKIKISSTQTDDDLTSNLDFHLFDLFRKKKLNKKFFVDVIGKAH